MFNDNNNRNVNLNHPPLYLLELYAPRGVQIVTRNQGIPAIAAYRRTLPPKVASLVQGIDELKKLEAARNELFSEGAALAADLHVATLTWRTRVLVDFDGLDPAEIAITETKMVNVVLANARRLITVLEGRDAEVLDAAEARAELEAKYSSTEAALAAVHDGRAAVHDKQRELHVVAAAVHQELVKLRKTVRMVKGSNHPDYQYLRIVKGRVAEEPPVETGEEPVSSESEAASTTPSDGASRPSSVG